MQKEQKSSFKFEVFGFFLVLDWIGGMREPGGCFEVDGNAVVTQCCVLEIAGTEIACSALVASEAEEIFG